METALRECPLASVRCVQTDRHRATWPSLFLYHPAAEGASLVL
jgi:hypothetical protein